MVTEYRESDDGAGKLRHGMTAIPGSERSPAPKSRLVGPTHPETLIEITILVRGQRSLSEQEAFFGGGMSREAFAEAYGAKAATLSLVEAFAAEHRLEVVSRDRAKRTVALRGTARQLSLAFGVDLNDYERPDGHYHGRVGPIHLPSDVAAVVEGVFGLDNRPQAKPHIVMRRDRDLPEADGRIPVNAIRPATAPTEFTPVQLAHLYDFPEGSNGAGQTIGIVEFGGGYLEDDLHAYFANLHLKPPDVVAVGVDGAANHPTAPDIRGETPDSEVMLDIEVAGGAAPGAKLVVYFAPFTERGWVDVLRTAVHDQVHTPTILSISWGWTEGLDIWTRQALQAVSDVFKEAAALGVTVLCASGDDGSADEQADGKRHVDFPASCPFVTGVGGTSLVNWKVFGTEAVWNDGPRATGGGAGGGGVSKVFRRPAYQSALAIPPAQEGAVPGRGIPDVAANADPNSGYAVRVRGRSGVAGGTSASAPLWAALVARLNQKLERSLGFLNILIYSKLAGGAAFRDITVGNNDTTGRLGGFPALRGWDAATGWGVPVGSAILRSVAEMPAPTSTARQAPARADSESEHVPEWKRVPGFGQAISVGSDGTVWAVGGIISYGGYLVHRWSGSKWGRGDHAAVRISVGPAGRLTTLDAFGVVKVHDAESSASLPGVATDITHGPDGSLWAVGNITATGHAELARWDGSAWLVHDGTGVRLAITAHGEPALVTQTGGLLLRSKSGWMTFPGLYSDVAAGVDGTLYGLGTDGAAYSLSAASGSRHAIFYNAADLAVGKPGLWVVTSDGRILNCANQVQ
jgi:kumamolisin